MAINELDSRAHLGLLARDKLHGFKTTDSGNQNLENHSDSNNNCSSNIDEPKLLYSCSYSAETIHETEDWQILNQEDDMSPEGEQKLCSSPSMHSSKENFQDGQKLKPKLVRRYIEYERPDLKKLSPYLINLCTAIYSLMPLVSLIATLVLLGTFFTRFYYLSILYFLYLFLDRKTYNSGGRRLNSIYRSQFWSYLAAYFPIKLRYSPNFSLDPKENYILNYSPHGISAFGAVTAFATDGLGFSKLFPGITPRFMVHETSFAVPVMKETFATRGDCSVNSKSIDYMLSRPKSRGNLLTIVVGGLAEADLSDERVLRIVVAERKGFVKKALVHGAHIIPCIAFGENSVFKKVNFEPSSFMHRLESRWYKLFKFKHPVYFGRSLFSDKLSGVMPYKRPITVVMGDPIHVAKNETPSQPDIDTLHAKYLERLRYMYETNKDLTEKYDKILELV